VILADPYRRCGLRQNPFAYENEDSAIEATWVQRGRPPTVDPGRRRLIQVVGVRGAGKTSTLRGWRAEAPGPWLCVPPGIRRLQPLPIAGLVYWDEADRAPAVLRRWAWRTAYRRGATVVAGTHVDLESEARAAGLAVDTVTLAPISAAELVAWAAQRFAAIGADPSWALPDPVAADLAGRAGASWRTAGDLLHSWVAGEVTTRAAP
jgi:hypothetical protein